MSLKVGMYSKKSCRMNRAVIGSPPVRALIFAFGPAAAFLGFDRRHEARAHEAGEVCRMLGQRRSR